MGVNRDAEERERGMHRSGDEDNDFYGCVMTVSPSAFENIGCIASFIDY